MYTPTVGKICPTSIPGGTTGGFLFIFDCSSYETIDSLLDLFSLWCWLSDDEMGQSGYNPFQQKNKNKTKQKTNKQTNKQ